MCPPQILILLAVLSDTLHQGWAKYGLQAGSDPLRDFVWLVMSPSARPGQMWQVAQAMAHAGIPTVPRSTAGLGRHRSWAPFPSSPRGGGFFWLPPPLDLAPVSLSHTHHQGQDACRQGSQPGGWDGDLDQ